MPDVSKATMYRQVALLVDNRLIEVDGEERKGGAVERRYRLHPSRAIIDADTAAAMSNDDHRRGFGASLATLLAEFGSYLDQDDANPTADMVSYRQVPVWLSSDEKRALYDRLLETIRPYLGQRGHPGSPTAPAGGDLVPHSRQPPPPAEVKSTAAPGSAAGWGQSGYWRRCAIERRGPSTAHCHGPLAGLLVSTATSR